MKNIIYIITLLIISTSVQARQASDTAKGLEVISLPDYYNQKGIVFTEHYNLKVDLGDIKGRYSPSMNEIRKAEEIFFRDYATFTKQHIDPKKYFCNYVRQYIGYLDSNGSKILSMQLIDNSKPRRMNRILGRNWEMRYIVYLSDEIPFSNIVLIVDLTKGKITR